MSLADVARRLVVGEKSPDVATPEPGAVADNRNPARDAARADVNAEVQKRKRGRPPVAGSGGAGAGPTGPTADQLALAKIQEGLDRLYRPEAWEPIVALPANVALAFTGHEHWNIPKDERVNLATTASTAAQFMAISNPRSLALTMFALAVMTVYGPRIIKEVAMRKTDNEKAKKDKETKTG